MKSQTHLQKTTTDSNVAIPSHPFANTSESFDPCNLHRQKNKQTNKTQVKPPTTKSKTRKEGTITRKKEFLQTHGENHGRRSEHVVPQSFRLETEHLACVGQNAGGKNKRDKERGLVSSNLERDPDREICHFWVMVWICSSGESDAAIERGKMPTAEREKESESEQGDSRSRFILSRFQQSGDRSYSHRGTGE